MSDAMKTEWQELEKMSEPMPAAEIKTMTLEKLALHYQVLVENQKFLAADIKAVKEKFGSMVNEEPGEYVIPAGKFDVHVNRSEKFEWDQEMLEDLWAKLATSPNPIIEASFSVDKKKYQKLDATQRMTIDPALTRKPGTMTVKVTLAGEGKDDDNTSV